MVFGNRGLIVGANINGGTYNSSAFISLLLFLLFLLDSQKLKKSVNSIYSFKVVFIKHFFNQFSNTP